jgi:hypothetical protein
MDVFALWVGANGAGSSAGSPLPDADAVRRTAEEVLSRPQFAPDALAERGHSIGDLLLRIFLNIIGAIMRAFESLHDVSPILAWLLTIALVISLVLLVGHIIVTLVSVFRRDPDARRFPGAATRIKVDPVALAREASQAAGQGDYILGVRLLFRACLARLEQAEGTTFRAGSTNREHLNRFRSTPLHEWLARFVSVIDLKWYGHEPCLAADFGACREAYERICSLSASKANAQ